MSSSSCADRSRALPFIQRPSMRWAWCCRFMWSWSMTLLLRRVRWTLWRFLASGRAGSTRLRAWLRQKRSKSIAYLAARFDAVVSVRALASVLNLPLAMTERAPLASQLSRFRQFEIGRDLFAGQFASAFFDLPFTLLFVILLFPIGGVAGFCADRAFLGYRGRLRAWCDRQHCADRQGQHEQAEVRRVVVRAHGQASDHQTRFGRTHMAGPLRRKPCDLSTFARRESAAQLPPAGRHKCVWSPWRGSRPSPSAPCLSCTARCRWRAGRRDDDRLAGSHSRFRSFRSTLRGSNRRCRPCGRSMI